MPSAKVFFRKCCRDVGNDELELIAYVATRWSSWLNVLERMVKQKKVCFFL